MFFFEVIDRMISPIDRILCFVWEGPVLLPLLSHAGIQFRLRKGRESVCCAAVLGPACRLSLHSLMRCWRTSLFVTVKPVKHDSLCSWLRTSPTVMKALANAAVCSEWQYNRFHQHSMTVWPGSLWWGSSRRISRGFQWCYVWNAKCGTCFVFVISSIAGMWAELERGIWQVLLPLQRICR